MKDKKENESKVIKLFTDGTVKTKDREFTRIIGGFNDDKPTITDKQIGELLGYSKGARDVRDRLNRKDSYGKKNIKHFEEGIHIIDLQRVAEKDTLIETLQSLGYAKQSITQAEHIYIFSEAGFLLFLKFAEGDKAVELYKDFLEDYFKTKAENVVMKKSIDEEIEELKKDKAMFIGMSVVEKDDSKKIEWLNKMENINNRITELEKTKSEQEIIKKYKTEITLGKDICNSNNCYDIGKFSKILAIKGMGRNNLFEWMRYKGILRPNNEPYQQYIDLDYFKVIPIQNNRFADSKTLLKAKGIKSVVNKLIKDGKVITKSVDEILKELEPEKIA